MFDLPAGEFENDEFDGVREENIIDGERSTRAKNFAKADEEADRVVEEVVEANSAFHFFSVVEAH